MVHCPQCGVDVTGLFLLEKWKYLLGIVPTMIKGKEIHCCYGCAIETATNYVNKNHYVTLKLSKVK